MSIVIPKRLEKLLKKEQIWHTNIMQLSTNTAGLYQDSPEFFPDYTFHGFGHINTVLEYAEQLIEQKTLRQLKPRDVAFLIAAVILHDAGMFLRRDGVQKLVTGSRRENRIEHSGDESWEKSWENFVDRTKRYPQKKMRYLFGQNITVEASCISKADLSDNDKRVIGEFIRQSHGRIAHEIALNDLPGTEDIDLFARTAFTREDRDLIGLLSRSHTMAIRDTEPYLRRAFGRGPMPYGTPVYYLMAVLRMADALDAGKHRISRFRNTQQKIRIPVSVEEWTWNERINPDICRWDPDENSRYIYAAPTSSIEYVQLDKWLKSTQAELDLCWSVLAEKYRDKPYRLSIHRVLCNIHEPDVQEAMNGRFLTREVKVTANPEIVKLMIVPLYGDNPSYGVRELLQNAVDACIEREEKARRAKHPYQGRVRISLDRQCFLICDNGIGMDENVLLNYYLCAGSSFRSSDEWKREYTADGRSRIARTGRFGVGFLAAFLLGDTIEVCTQHLSDEKGYAFSFDQNSKPLSIRRVSRPDGPGTTISIRLKEGVYEKLKNREYPSWLDWYAFDDPIVEYIVDEKQEFAKDTLLHRDPEQNSGWFTLDSDLYTSYQWHPNPGIGKFLCNGIQIKGAFCPTPEEYGLPVDSPAVSVIDKNGALNIDLPRTRLPSFPEKERLLAQLFRYHIAKILMVPWDTNEDARLNLETGFPLRNDKRVPFLLSTGGYQLSYASFLRAMGFDRLMLLYSTETDSLLGIREAGNALPTGIPFAIVPGFTGDCVDSRFWSTYGIHAGSPQMFADGILSDSISILQMSNLGYRVSEAWTYAWIRTDAFREIHDYRKQRMATQNWRHSGEDYVVAETTQWRQRSVRNGSTASGIDGIREQISSGNYLPSPCFPAAFLICLETDETIEPLFSRVLKTVLAAEPGYPQDLWIPFDMEERRKKFRTAFRELEPYLHVAEADRFWSSQHQPRYVVPKEMERKLESAQSFSQQLAMRMEAEEQQRAEMIVLLEAHQPELLVLLEEMNRGTKREGLQKFYTYICRSIIADCLGISMEEAPAQISEKWAALIIKGAVATADEEELKDLDRTDFEPFTLDDLMEALEIPAEELIDEMEEFPPDIRNECYEILEEIQHLYNKT